MVGFHAIVAVAILMPHTWSGVAIDSLKAAIKARDADTFCKWYPFAVAYSDRDRLRCLLAFSIPGTDGRLQAILIGRLTAFRTGAVPYIPVLVKVLLDPKSKNRDYVAIDLGWMGPLAEGAVGPLKLSLKSPDASLRHYACVALWRIEHRPASIIPTLIQGLSRELHTGRVEKFKFPIDGVEVELEFRPSPEERFSTQSHMLSAIDTIGPSIRSAVWPAIARLHDSSDARVRNMVCLLVPKFCPDQGVASRVLGAELANHGINFNTRANFKQLGAAGVPELSRLVFDPATRLVALDVLTSLGKDGASAAKLVGTYKDDPDEAIRKQARAALEAFGKSEK